MPWNTVVVVSWGGSTVDVPLIDEGPAGGLKSEAQIDLTFPAWLLLTGGRCKDKDVNNIEAHVMFRIPNGAQYIGDYWPAGVPRPEGQ